MTKQEMYDKIYGKNTEQGQVIDIEVVHNLVEVVVDNLAED
jgi:hypothetical protein